MLTKIGNILEKVLIVISCSFIGAAVLATFIEVLRRKITSASLGWVEEASRFAYIYAIFLLSGPMLRRGMHIRVEAFYNRFGPKSRKVVAVTLLSLVLVAAVSLCWWSIRVIKLSLAVGEKSVTPFPVDPWAWQLAVALGMLILIFYCVERMVLLLRKGEDPFHQEIRTDKALEQAKG